ncbi:MAG: hypothetical protein ABIO14_03445, partial [Aeromicrobium sp.]
MSDANDPFAAKPYVPPTASPPVAGGDTEVPVEPVAETPEAPVADTPAIPAIPETPEATPTPAATGAEGFTHRYPHSESFTPDSAGAGASTQQLPAFPSASERPPVPPQEKKTRGKGLLVAGTALLLGVAGGVGG